MKFIINSQALLKKLQYLNGVINSNNTLPILDDFLFELDESTLRITATDLETTLIMTLEPSMADESGKVTIPAKLLLDFLKYLPDAPITFNIDSNTLAIEILSSEGKYKLTGHNADEIMWMFVFQMRICLRLTVYPTLPAYGFLFVIIKISSRNFRKIALFSWQHPVSFSISEGVCE